MAINMHMEGVDVGGVAGDLGLQPQSSDSTIDPVRTNTDAGPSNSLQGAENPNDLEDDEVRAPIPQKQETLIEAGYEGYQMNNRQNYRKARIRTVFDGFRNFGNEASSKYSSICNKTTGSYKIRRDIQLHSSISMKHRFLGRAAISNKPREETYIRRAI